MRNAVFLVVENVGMLRVKAMVQDVDEDVSGAMVGMYDRWLRLFHAE